MSDLVTNLRDPQNHVTRTYNFHRVTVHSAWFKSVQVHLKQLPNRWFGLRDWGSSTLLRRDTNAIVVQGSRINNNNTINQVDLLAHLMMFSRFRMVCVEC